MTRSVQVFVCLIATLCTGAASAQVAYVYVSTADGTYAYDASSTGKLTLIKGSPFQTVGSMVGTNGQYFVTVGTDYVFSYEVASNGAIGKEVSKINTQSYSGSQCGTADGGVLDHSGEDVYVYLQGASVDNNGSTDCDDFQTFGIGKTGTLTFKGDISFGSQGRYGATQQSLPVFSGNNKFAFSVGCCYPDSGDSMLDVFARESSGALELASGGETDPVAPAGYYFYPYGLITDDPTNHLAVVLYPSYEPPSGIDGPLQVGSYTIDSQGGITSTNTYENMPTPADGISEMKMDPTGKYLAIATGPGVQLYHFNGAEPITPFTGIIGTSGQIVQIAWAGNQLYALNGASGRMHVYTVTSTSVKEASGSPTVIPVGALTVRPH